MRNEFSGDADDVVQARDIYGQVHIQHGRPGTPLPVPRQLPPAVTHFVNRDDELDVLDAVLGSEPSVEIGATALTTLVITGTAGLGKTSLAVHWAHRMRHRFPDGELYVNLRGYDSGPVVGPARALDGFLRALDVPAEKIPRDDLDALTGLYRSLLAQRRLLVLLDNASTAAQVRPLLPSSPTCPVIVTSRSRLSGLLAREGGHRIALDVLPPSHAVALLQGVVGTARVKAERGVAALLARRCAYLPLALRIAAERVAVRPHLSLAELARELAVERDRLDVLAVYDDDVAEVRTVLSWSYHALPAEAARVFRLLGLHAGPDISLAAAAALAGLSIPAVRSQLDVLTGMHLLEEHAVGRYRFHDLLRAYAAERSEIDEPDAHRVAAIRTVLIWYLHTANSAQGVLYPQRRHLDISVVARQPLSFTNRTNALNWCDTERANLMAAVRQAADTGNDDIAWRLPIVMGSYLALRFHWADKLAAQEIGIKAARRAHDLTGEFWLLGSLGETYGDLRRFDEAAPLFQRALVIAQEIGDRWGEGAAHHGVGLAYLGLDRFDEATRHFHDAAAVFRDIDDQRGEAVALEYLADTLRRERRFEEAIDYLRRALVIHRTKSDRPREAWSVRILGLVHLDLQLLDDAVEQFQYALAIYRDLGDRNEVAHTLDNLGEAYRQARRLGEARASLREAVALFDDLKSPESIRASDRLRALDERSSGEG